MLYIVVAERQICFLMLIQIVNLIFGNFLHLRSDTYASDCMLASIQSHTHMCKHMLVCICVACVK